VFVAAAASLCGVAAKSRSEVSSFSAAASRPVAASASM